MTDMTPATATLEMIRPSTDDQHPTDPARVAAIIGRVCGDCDGSDGDCYHDDVGIEDWTLPPILAVEDEGFGHIVLDGHHRAAAARELGLPEIPAYTISVADYCRILDEAFGGYGPPRLADLDEHILIDGRPYADRV